jgi:hypothetical protein
MSRIHIYEIQGTAQRSIQFCVSPSAFTGPNNRLIVWEEKVPSNQPHWISKSISSPTAISFTDIFDECLRTAKCGFEGQHDIVDFYYSRLSEKKYSYKSLFELFGQISGGNHSQIQDRTHIVPRNILNKWMESKYPDASDYWSAKKTVIITNLKVLHCFSF